MAEPDRLADFGGDPHIPPSKKPRLEPPRPVTPTPGTPIDDLDDLYGTPSRGNTPLPVRDLVVLSKAPTPTRERILEPQLPGVIPGLGLLTGNTQPTTVEAADSHETEEPTNGVSDSEDHEDRQLAAMEKVNSDPQTPQKALITDTVDAEVILGTLPGNETHKDGLMLKAVSSQSVPHESEAGHDSHEVNLLSAEDAASEGEPEWELDSSPVDTMSLSNSSSSSEEDDAEDYQLLDAEEQARILMQDIESDEEGDNSKHGKTGSARQVRTKNEIVEEKVEKPNVNITADMRLEDLGAVEFLVENLAVIKANVSGEYQVLESGSVLCLGDRIVIGVVAETLGRVQQPYYSVRFNNREEMTKAGVAIGTKIFYVPQYSSRALTQTLKAVKGSDASNFHDEEVGDDELEFSNDEAEAEHKRKMKQKDRHRKSFNPGEDVSVQRNTPQTARNNGLSYEDPPASQEANDFDEDLYTPLARPSNFQDLIGGGNVRSQMATPRGNARRTHRGGSGRGRDRGRGDRGRGDRGRGGRGARWARGDRGHRPEQTRDMDRRRHEDYQDQPRRSTVTYEPAVPAYDKDHRPNQARDVRRRSYEEYQEHPQQSPVPYEPAAPSYDRGRLSDQTWDNHNHNPGYQHYRDHPQQSPISSEFAASPYGYGYQNTRIPSTGSFSYASQPGPLAAPQLAMPFPQVFPQAPYGWAQPPPQVEFPFAPASRQMTSLSPPPVNPAGPLPAGAYVNPAFFRNPQSTPMRSQGSPPPHRQGMSSVSSQGGILGVPETSMSSDAAFRAAQEKLDILRGLSRAGSGSP